MATLGQKLTFITKNNGITDEDLGEALGVVRSTVCKWRSGKLKFNKKEYASKVADFFVSNIDRAWLLSLLPLPQDDSEDDKALGARIAHYLFDGSDIILRPIIQDHIFNDAPVKNEGCFLGMKGLSDALSLFSAHLRGEKEPPPISVYLSSEYCSLLLEDRADLLWDYLYKINGNRPVIIIFERWQETGRVTKILQCLLPFILAKKLELHYIPSTERLFCYNISFVAKDKCMVMTTEPAGAFGTCVSLYVDSKEFVVPMSKVLAKLTRLARPIAKHIELPRIETERVNSLYTGVGDINAMFDCANLLYASVDGFHGFLEACNFSYDERLTPLSRFELQKNTFNNFLLRETNREIISLDAIDDFIVRSSMKIPELSFPAETSVPVSLEFIKEVLEGMVDYLERYRNLQIILTRGTGNRDVVWRLKEDRLIVLHSFGGNEKTCIYSENWLFIDHYMNLLEDAYRGKNTVRGKMNVISALQNRINRINEIQGGGQREK